MTKFDRLSKQLLVMYKKEVEKNSLKHFVYSTENTVRKFIENRLVFHGRNGYKFHASKFYRKHYLSVGTDKELSKVVEYIVECNMFRKQLTIN